MGIWEKLLGGKKERIFAPMPGETVPLADVPDETFAKEILGKGIAIRPASGSVCAPCAGRVDMVFETGHAITLTADNGAEILVHVGLDTVNLKGKYFHVHAKAGQRAAKGDLLLEFYENHMATGTYGAINHIAVNVTDAAAALEEIKAAGCYTLINTELQFRPYWENGCQFFNVEGPNKEILEFNQLL